MTNPEMRAIEGRRKVRARRARLSTGKGYLYVLVVGERRYRYVVCEARGRWGTHPLYRTSESAG